MARLDVASLQKLKAIKGREMAEGRKALSKYHYLACVHHFTNTSDLKHQLVEYFPEISAQIFYHFDDRELGGLIVQDYSTHKDGELRNLANGVKNVLHARVSSNNQLDNILGVTSLPVKEIEDYNPIVDGIIDNSERAIAYEFYTG